MLRLNNIQNIITDGAQFDGETLLHRADNIAEGQVQFHQLCNSNLVRMAKVIRLRDFGVDGTVGNEVKLLAPFRRYISLYEMSAKGILILNRAEMLTHPYIWRRGIRTRIVACTTDIQQVWFAKSHHAPNIKPEAALKHLARKS